MTLLHCVGVEEGAVIELQWWPDAGIIVMTPLSDDKAASRRTFSDSVRSCLYTRSKKGEVAPKRPPPPLYIMLFYTLRRLAGEI